VSTNKQLQVLIVDLQLERCHANFDNLLLQSWVVWVCYMHVDLSVHYRRNRWRRQAAKAIIAYTNASLDQESQIHSILHQWNMSNGGHTHCQFVHRSSCKLKVAIVIAESKVQFLLLLSQFVLWLVSNIIYVAISKINISNIVNPTVHLIL